MPGGGSSGDTRAAGRGGGVGAGGRGNAWVTRGTGGGAATAVDGRTGAGGLIGGAMVSLGLRSEVGASSSNGGNSIGVGMVSDGSARAAARFIGGGDSVARAGGAP